MINNWIEKKLTMEILYSDILPLSMKDGQKSILDAFREQLAASDSFEFAVG